MRNATLKMRLCDILIDVVNVHFDCIIQMEIEKVKISEAFSSRKTIHIWMYEMSFIPFLEKPTTSTPPPPTKTSFLFISLCNGSLLLYYSVHFIQKYACSSLMRHITSCLYPQNWISSNIEMVEKHGRVP